MEIEKNEGKMYRYRIRRRLSSSSSATPASLHIRPARGPNIPKLPPTSRRDPECRPQRLRPTVAVTVRFHLMRLFRPPPQFGLEVWRYFLAWIPHLFRSLLVILSPLLTGRRS